MFRFSLAQKFSLILLIALAAFAFSVGEIMSSAMCRNMVTRSGELTAHFLEHEIRHHFHPDILSGSYSAQEYAKISNTMAELDLGPDISIGHIQICNRKHAVVWSSDARELGKKALEGTRFAPVFNGRIQTEFPGPVNWVQKLGITSHPAAGMELLVPVRSGPAGEVDLVVAVDATVDKLMDDIARQNRIVWLLILSGSLLLYLILYGLYRGAARQIERRNDAIRTSEELYRSVIQSAEEGIVAADKQGRIFLMNRAAEKIFGYSLARDTQLDIGDLLHLEASPPLKAWLEKFIASGECSGSGKSYEAEGRRKSGEMFPLEILLSVSGEAGSCILTGMIRDTTQRNQLIAQITEAEQEWEECFDTINDAITIHDRDFNIIQANLAATEMLGRPLEDILGRKCFICYHGKESPPELCPSCETLRTGIESTSEVFEPHLNKYLEVKALPRFDSENRLSGLVHVVRDITDRKEAEAKEQKLQAQLNQAQKMESVGRLAGGIAHDFNNILSVIIGYSELIQRNLPRETRLYQDINTIRESGEKAAMLTGQLLAFSRKQVLRMQSVDLNRIVEDMAKMLRRVISEDIYLDLHLSPKIGRIIADPGQMEQVLLNLAVNARDAMPDGGHFIVETSMIDIGREYVDQHAEAQLGPHVLLAVTDTGTGIAGDAREHIFEPFFTTKETGKGTGLGLATVYGIVKQHGGQIYVYSEPGKGSTFKIYLPAPPHAVIEEKPSGADNIPTGSETILIAEDDDSIRKMVGMFLEPIGYTVMPAADGKEAIAVSNAYEGRIDVLLTDVIMPTMNGQELADELKLSRPDMKVIFMSGYTDDVIAHHGVLESGVNFIQKPLTLIRLAHKLREVLDRKNV